jgi:hypothetical protein
MLVRIAGWTVFLHLLQIAAWAFFYTWKEGMPDLTSAFYFSAVTYTTTGYGDLVLPQEWRVVGGVEALTGISDVWLVRGNVLRRLLTVFRVHEGDAPVA